MNIIIEKLGNFWWEALASIAVGWFLFRQKFLKQEYETMKEKIATLEKQHVELSSTLNNVKKNQEIMRDTQQDIQKDIKTLIDRTAKKGWFK